jgi:hypothetical protein
MLPFHAFRYYYHNVFSRARSKMTDETRNETKPDDNELVELISEQGEVNARLLVGILESEGIEVMLKSHQTFSALPFTVDGMGEVRIMVRREDLERARTILKEYTDREE